MVYWARAKAKIGVFRSEAFKDLILFSARFFSSELVGYFSLLRLTILSKTFFWEWKPYTISIK